MNSLDVRQATSARSLCVLLAGAAPTLTLTLALFSEAALAQSFQTKLLRIVVPYAATGPVDLAARLMAPKFSEASGQPAIVDNRTGGGSIVGTQYVVKAPPDGHTLLLMPTQVAINPSMYPLPFDTLADLAGITQLTAQPYMLVSPPTVPFKTVRELIAAAKAKPDALRCGSSGVGGGTHLACELFNKMAGTQITHVPYKGAAPALNGILAGEVEIYMPNPITVIQFVKSGKLRVIAFTGKQRISMMPDVPTVAESGLPGYEAVVWLGLFAPAATPRDLIRRINQETVRVLNLPDIRKALTSEGGEIVGSTPEQFTEFMKAEVAKWTEIVKFSGAKPE